MKKSPSSSSPRQGTTALARELQPLIDAQHRNEERMGRLEESMAALADSQRHIDEQIRTLAEAQRRTEEQVTALVQAQRSTQESIQQLARTVGALSDNIDFGLEDIARVVLPGYLQRHFGIMLDDDALERYFTLIDQQLIEFDLYGKGQQNGERVVVVGECKSCIRSSQVEEFARRVAQLRPELQDKLVPVMFGFWIHPSATEVAQQTGIVLIASYQR